MDRPVVEDMKHILYFPALANDPRNKMHGYLLDTDADGSHENCDDNQYVYFSLLMTSSS